MLLSLATIYKCVTLRMARHIILQMSLLDFSVMTTCSFNKCESSAKNVGYCGKSQSEAHQ